MLARLPPAASSVLALLLAGCVSTSQVTPTSDPLALPALPEVPGLPIVQDHDHGDPLLHTASFATELVSVATGTGGPVPEGVYFGEVEVKDGFAYVCRGGFDEGLGPLPGTVGGFVIVDVQDPRAPRPTGEFAGVACVDIKVNDAGTLVLYGTQRNPPHELATNDAEPAAKAPRGIYLVDVADKASPRLARFVPLPVNGVHTLHYVDLDGRELLFVQTYDWLPDAGLGTGLSTGLNAPLTPRITIYDIVQGADGRADLRFAGLFAIPEQPPPGTNWYPHDITVQKHPRTGQWLGYVAYWDHGLVILDLADPARPREVSRFADTSPSGHVNIHQARPFPHLIDGKHVTVLEPELVTADESGQFTLVDTTDPADPKRLGFWTLPGNLVVDQPFIFSPHNFNLANGRIYLAHNHAGVWVVDVGSAERLLEPAAVGFYQPHAALREAPDCVQSRVWSAFYVQGFVYASDSCSGLNVLQFEGDQPLEGQGPMRVMAAAPAP